MYMYVYLANMCDCGVPRKKERIRRALPQSLSTSVQRRIVTLCRKATTRSTGRIVCHACGLFRKCKGSAAMDWLLDDWRNLRKMANAAMAASILSWLACPKPLLPTRILSVVAKDSLCLFGVAFPLMRDGVFFENPSRGWYGTTSNHAMVASSSYEWLIEMCSQLQ